jgi:hypothetical protein
MCGRLLFESKHNITSAIAVPPIVGFTLSVNSMLLLLLLLLLLGVSLSGVLLQAAEAGLAQRQEPTARRGHGLHW